MSLSLALTNVGHPVAYYPRLAKFLGSVNAAIFFCQIFYLSLRCSSDLGVYKTAKEIEDETGLSYREQATARKMLVERGFMTEVNKRIEHRIYFQPNIEAMDGAFDAWVKSTASNDENAFPERRKRISGNAESAIRELRQTQSVYITKTTTETTTQNVREDDDKFDAFWRVYPRKDAKASAKKAFKKLKADESMLAMLVKAVKMQRESVAWNRDGGQFVPHAATWLNGRRWEDVIQDKASDALPEWCKLAGFPHVDVARSQGCTAANAHLFRDGKFYNPNIPAHKRLAMREAV